jgi:hypothetical protein
MRPSPEEIFKAVCDGRSKYSELTPEAKEISDEFLLHALSDLEIWMGIDIGDHRLSSLMEGLREEFCEGDIWNGLRKLRKSQDLSKDITFARGTLRFADLVFRIRETPPFGARQAGYDHDSNLPIWEPPDPIDHDYIRKELKEASTRQLGQGSRDNRSRGRQGGGR